MKADGGEQKTRHLTHDEMLEYVSHRASRADLIRMSVHASICGECSERVQALEYVRDNFDSMWESLAGAPGLVPVWVGEVWAKLSKYPAEAVEATRRAICDALSPPFLMIQVKTLQPEGVYGRVLGPGTAERSYHTRAGVLSANWEPTGKTARFTMDKEPQVTEDGRFQAKLKSGSSTYVGSCLLCTVRLPNSQSVSFSGIIAAEGKGSEVTIDEHGVECGSSGLIPRKAVRLRIIDRTAYERAVAI